MFLNKPALKKIDSDHMFLFWHEKGDLTMLINPPEQSMVSFYFRIMDPFGFKFLVYPTVQMLYPLYRD